MNKNFLVIIIVLVAVMLTSFQQKQKFDLKASVFRGQDIYSAQCLTCHMENGEGLEGIYPPLAKSDYLMDDKVRSIRQVLNGVSEEITVNGKVYNGMMTGFDLTDEQVSDVLNYVRNSWGNKGPAITPVDVASVRGQ